MSSRSRHAALFRLSQSLARPTRKLALQSARSKLHNYQKGPLKPKLMGFITETRSLEYIPECLVCGNKYLHYSFLDYLLGKPEKSWRDIECLECKQFIVEVKSTKMKYPKHLFGGCYQNFQQMNIKPHLLVFRNLECSHEGKYTHEKPLLYTPDQYHVIPGNYTKSLIILDKELKPSTKQLLTNRKYLVSI